MAARRLLIVMLILLGASTLAAALVPVPEPDEEQEQAAPKPPDRSERTGRLVRETVRVPGRHGEDGGGDGDDQDVPTVRIALGDQLQLTVHARRPDEVEIPAVGELREVGPDAPARFDLLPFETGTFVVRLVGADRTVARIEVERRTEAPSVRRPADGAGGE